MPRAFPAPSLPRGIAALGSGRDSVRWPGWLVAADPLGRPSVGHCLPKAAPSGGLGQCLALIVKCPLYASEFIEEEFHSLVHFRRLQDSDERSEFVGAFG